MIKCFFRDSKFQISSWSAMFPRAIRSLCRETSRSPYSSPRKCSRAGTEVHFWTRTVNSITESSPTAGCPWSRRLDSKLHSEMAERLMISDMPSLGSGWQLFFLKIKILKLKRKNKRLKTLKDKRIVRVQSRLFPIRLYQQRTQRGSEGARRKRRTAERPFRTVHWKNWGFSPQGQILISWIKGPIVFVSGFFSYSSPFPL